MEWSAVRICVLQCEWRSREILVSTLERKFESCETWIYWMKVAAALASFLAFSKDFSFWMVLALNFLKGMNNIDGKGTWKNRKLKFKLYRWREKQRNAQIEKKDSLRKREREREFAHNRKEMNHLKWYSDETEERERGNVNLDFGWAIIGLWPELGTYDEKTLPVSLPTASGTLADLFEVLN